MYVICHCYFFKFYRTKFYTAVFDKYVIMIIMTEIIRVIKIFNLLKALYTFQIKSTARLVGIWTN